MQCKTAEEFEGPRTFEIRLKCPAAQQAALLEDIAQHFRQALASQASAYEAAQKSDEEASLVALLEDIAQGRSTVQRI